MKLYPQLLKLTAFSTQPEGGNPAGVWIGDQLPTDNEMQEMAKEIGFSETAFITPTSGTVRTVRYFSPEMEIPFCGHATIASGVALGNLDGPATYQLETKAGRIPVDVAEINNQMVASLTSVSTEQKVISDDELAIALQLLGWSPSDLDPSISPMFAFAGAWHLVLAVEQHTLLEQLDYDFDGLKAFMQKRNLITLQLIWRESTDVFHSRNPFPVGGVVEDPATGAAAAAFGGYLRDAGIIQCPATFTIHQGITMGRPSRIEVEVPADGGIIVSGAAVEL